MIKEETCRGCGRNLWTTREAGLDVRVEATPLDGIGVMRATMNRAPLTEVVWRDGRPVKFQPTTPQTLSAVTGTPTGPYIAVHHRCTNRGTEKSHNAVQDSRRVTEVKTGPKELPTPVNPTQTPSRGQGRSDRVSSAGFRRTRTHPCDNCGRAVSLDGADVFAAELGATVVFAVHAGC